MKKLFSLFSCVLATMVATPVIAQLPFDYGYWDATEFGYGLNPPVFRPVESAWGNLGAYAEFVYFRPSEDDTFAYSVSSYETITTPVTGIGDEISSHFHRRKFDPNFKPGYRVGVLLNLPCDQWGIDANYTYFYSKTTKNSGIASFTDAFDPSAVTAIDPFVNNGAIINLPYTLSLFTEDDSFGTLTTSVGSTWKLRYNQVDVDLTRKFYVGPAVAFRPYFGFRGLFIQQNLCSSGIRNFAATTITDDSYLSTIRQRLKCNSDGYGVHGGNEVSFSLFDGFSLFGNVGIHLLWTHFTTEFHRTQITVADDELTVLATFNTPYNKESFDVMRFGADLEGGIEWWTSFNCGRNDLFVRFAWEHHIYMSQNAFRTYIEGETDFAASSVGGLLSSTGDLALYGFTVGAGFTF